MNLDKYILTSLTIISLTSCDPGLKGDLKIYNDTDQTLTLKCKDSEASDTIYSDIQPNSYGTIKVLSGLGDKKKFDCCPCRMQSIYIKSNFGQIKKDPNNSENWIIPNKSKLKKFNSKEVVKCEFHVTQADL